MKETHIMYQWTGGRMKVACFLYLSQMKQAFQSLSKVLLNFWPWLHIEAQTAQIPLSAASKYRNLSKTLYRSEAIYTFSRVHDSLKLVCATQKVRGRCILEALLKCQTIKTTTKIDMKCYFASRKMTLNKQKGIFLCVDQIPTLLSQIKMLTKNIFNCPLTKYISNSLSSS